MTRKSRPWGALRARWSALTWTVRGRWSLKRGHLAKAVSAFECAVSARPGAFRPLLRLAYGYLLSRDPWRAHRTLAQAREADPVRFVREVPPWLGRLGIEPALCRRLLGAGGPRQDGSPKVAHPVRAGRRPARRVEPGSLPLGDCVDLDEYARFRAMPPISESERESIDWDSVLEDLLDP